MQHVDDELLTLLALQVEQPGETTSSHLATCARCQAELNALRRVVAAGRLAPRDGDLIVPPPHVWEHIAASVGSDPARLHQAPTPPLRTVGEATSRPAHTRSLPTWLAVAAAFVIGAVAAGTLVAIVTDGDEPSQPQTQVAAADLEPLGAAGTAGSAQVVDADGRRLLDVEIDERTAGAGYREVWLLDADATRLVSLGVLTGTEAQLVIPDDLDLADFPVVDVSREPLDGDPAHSGDSIARGALDL